MNDENDTVSLSTRAANPFGAVATQRSAEVERSASQSIAEVQAAMVIAQKFPRNPVQAMERIINACTRPTLAEGALYTYARGGTDISGPSIRLAEVCAQNWGNLAFGIRELEQREGESTVEAFCWDMETNTKQVKVFTVPHIRYSKSKGNTKLIDPRDIYETVANNGARRLRACILGVIPGDVIEAAVDQCDKTLSADADISEGAIAKLVKAFAGLGVSKEQIETRIQRKIEAIRPAQVVALKKIGASIRDGMSEPAEWFPAVEAGASPPDKATKPAFKKAATKTITTPVDSGQGVTPKPEDAATPKPAEEAKPDPAPPAESAPQNVEASESGPPADAGQGEPADTAQVDPEALEKLSARMEEQSVRRPEVIEFLQSNGSKATTFRGIPLVEAQWLLANWDKFLKEKGLAP